MAGVSVIAVVPKADQRVLTLLPISGLEDCGEAGKPLMDILSLATWVVIQELILFISRMFGISSHFITQIWNIYLINDMDLSLLTILGNSQYDKIFSEQY
jgi:hypothetical protein